MLAYLGCVKFHVDSASVPQLTLEILGIASPYGAGKHFEFSGDSDWEIAYFTKLPILTFGEST